MSVKKSLAWMGAAQAAAFVFQFGSSVVLARYLTPHEMGIFAIGLATVGMLSVLQNFGLQALIVREEKLTESVATTVFTINALVAVVISSATIVCGYLSAKYLREEGVRQVLIVLSISPLFGILSFLPGAQMERHGRFREIALISVATSVFGAIVTVILAMLDFKYMSMAYASVLGSAALAAMFIIAGRSYFSCHIGFQAWKRVADFGFQMFAVSSLGSFSQRFCEFILGRMLGLPALGLYSRASGMNSMLWGSILFLVRRVVLVDFASLHRQATPLGARYKQTVAIATAILWPAFGGLAVISKPFIVAVYGETWVTAAGPLRLLAIASMILVATTMAWEVCTATGNVRTQTRVEAIRTPLSVLLFVGGCLISLEAAAFSRIIDAVIAFSLYRPHLDRMTGTRLSDFIGIYVESAIATLSAICPAVLVTVWQGDRDPSLPLLSSAILLGIVLWMVTLGILRHPIFLEIIATLRNRFPGPQL